MRYLGQILLLLFFIALPLLKFLLQRVRKRRRDHRIPQEKPVEQMLRQAQTTPTPWPILRAAGDRVQGSPARTVIPLAKDRVTRRSLLGTTRDVRRGVVIMTLLGPCRAFDRGDSRRSDRSS
jgi:hypothetical protein